MSRLSLHFKGLPEQDRWLPGDRFVRPIVRRVLRGKPRLGGVGLVFHNLCAGLDLLGIPYAVNLPFNKLRSDDRVAVLGRGRACLDGYTREEPFVAGIALMTHPSEWPDLCETYPVLRYLQHSEWAANVYRPYYGDRCAIWPVGIDTRHWAPMPVTKSIDFLLYLKTAAPELKSAIQSELERLGLRYEIMQYGSYSPEEYHEALGRARHMIFLSSHESQGLACEECLSCGVPVLAWDPGQSLDPQRFIWGDPFIPATSVPYFDSRCGMTFPDIAAFPGILHSFLEHAEANAFSPRDYIEENLTLEKCSKNFVELVEKAYTAAGL